MYVKRAELVRENKGLTSQLIALRKEYKTLLEVKQNKGKIVPSKVKTIVDTKEINRLEALVARERKLAQDAVNSAKNSKRHQVKAENLKHLLEQRLDIRDGIIKKGTAVIRKYKDLGFWGKLNMAFKSKLDVDMFFLNN